MNKSDPFGDMPPNNSFMTGDGSNQAEQSAAAEEPVHADHVGALLCATRMRLGGDLQEIARILRIRYGYLVAIEDGRYEDLPGAAYSVGFVRAYADFLGLDGNEVVRRLREESAGAVKSTRFQFTSPSGDSGLPNGGLLAVAIGLGMIVYAAWYSISNADRDAVDLIQEVPGRLAVLLDEEPASSSDVIQPAQTAESVDPPLDDTGVPPSQAPIVTAAVQDAATQDDQSAGTSSDSSLVGSETGMAEPAEDDADSNQAGRESAAVEQAPAVEPPVTERAAAPVEEDTAAVIETAALPSEPDPVDVESATAPSVTEEAADTAAPPEAEQNVVQTAALPIEKPEEQTVTADVIEPETQSPPDPEISEDAAGETAETDSTVEEVASNTEQESNAALQNDDAEPAQTEPQDADVIDTADSGSATEEAVVANTPVDPEDLTIELRAKSDSWIQVRDGDDLLLTRLLRQGEVYRVPDRDGLTLMTGNAGGLEVFVGGELMPPLGDEGVVRRGVPLSAERLRSGTQPG